MDHATPTHAPTPACTSFHTSFTIQELEYELFYFFFRSSGFWYREGS